MSKNWLFLLGILVLHLSPNSVLGDESPCFPTGFVREKAVCKLTIDAKLPPTSSPSAVDTKGNPGFCSITEALLEAKSQSESKKPNVTVVVEGSFVWGKSDKGIGYQDGWARWGKPASSDEFGFWERPCEQRKPHRAFVINGKCPRKPDKKDTLCPPINSRNPKAGGTYVFPVKSIPDDEIIRVQINDDDGKFGDNDGTLTAYVFVQ